MSALLALLHALRRLSFKLWSQLWAKIWRFLRHCKFLMTKRRHSTKLPSLTPQHETEGGNFDGGAMLTKSEGDVQILASYLPSDRLQPSLHSVSTLRSLSRLSSTSSISVHVIPPDDDDDDAVSDWRSSRSDLRSIRGSSMTITTPNPMSSQTFQVSKSLTGSQISLVLPASPSLRSGDVVGPGATGSTGFSNGISDHIYPLLPCKVPRYKRQRYITTVGAQCEVDPVQDTFSLGEMPDGWEQITHPEGQPYFYHSEKAWSSLTRIVTECWIWDRELFHILDDFVDQFEEFVRTRTLKQPPDAHLILEINIEDGINWCGYYYASASTRSVFWLECFDVSHHLSEARGDITATHLKLFLEYQYWFHWDFFPNVNEATQGVYDAVANTINDARTDVQTSNTTTINQTADILKEMADIVESASRRRSSSSHWCLGRFMVTLMRDRFINYHGEYGARLNYIQSIHKTEPRKRTWLIKVFSPLLFAAPNTHLRSLEGLWVDQLTLRSRWTEFFVKLNAQWGEHIVHASILLNANVALLAIPMNDPSNNSTDFIIKARTAAQIASYVSVVTSFASMMLALMLVRQHKDKERTKEPVGEYHRYLHRHHKNNGRGFEDLAIIYSLPYALLTWGMLTFFIAFLIMCFVRSTPAAYSVVGVSIVPVAGLILWCIWMFWEETELHWRKLFKRIFSQKKKEEDPVNDENGDAVPEDDDSTKKGDDEKRGNVEEKQHTKPNSVGLWLDRIASWRGDVWKAARNANAPVLPSNV